MMSEWHDDHHRVIIQLDGKDVLHVCQAFYYNSSPYYSRVNSCGEYRPQITKEEFNAEMKRITELV